MNTIEEITRTLLNKSKHRQSIEINFSSESFIESITGHSDLSSKTAQANFNMLTSLLTELKEEDSTRRKLNSGSYNFYDYDTDINFGLFPRNHNDAYPLFYKFLNTYDKTGEAFKPLLEKLKAGSCEELADIIFTEIIPIRHKWSNILRNADPYLKLQLNNVDVEEIHALKAIADFGMFTSIVNNRIHSFAFDAETYLMQETGTMTKHDLVNDILEDYRYALPMKIELSDGTTIASTGDEFFKIGVNSQNKFIFEKLDKEISFNGYLIDFSETKGNVEKANTVKTLLQMVFLGSVETLETKHLGENEAVVFAMNYLRQKKTNQLNENGHSLSYDESMNMLKSLGSDLTNEFNRNFEFSDKAKVEILNFAKKIRTDQMDDLNHLPIIHMLEKVGLENITADHLDLWCIRSDVSKHSTAVRMINKLVDDYRYDRTATTELLAVAKKLDNTSLLLLESKLKCCNIDHNRFQQDLTKPPKKLMKLK